MAKLRQEPRMHQNRKSSIRNGIIWTLRPVKVQSLRRVWLFSTPSAYVLVFLYPFSSHTSLIFYICKLTKETSVLREPKLDYILKKRRLLSKGCMCGKKTTSFIWASVKMPNGDFLKCTWIFFSMILESWNLVVSRKQKANVWGPSVSEMRIFRIVSVILVSFIPSLLCCIRSFNIC